MSVESRRIPLISGNWKMNVNHFEAIQMVQKLAYLLQKEDYDHVDVSIHPPFTDLRSVQTLIDADGVRMKLGAQNFHPEDKGAFTGEVSPVFLAKLGVQYVIIGHSERRTHFGETDDLVARKVAAAFKHSLTPIVCVGETHDERAAGATMQRVLGQLRSAVTGRTKDQVASMVVAYEPLWAIGTGATATPSDAQDVIAGIRTEVKQLFNEAVGESIRLQYGGSVSAGTIAPLMREPDIDGALVGGASLDPAEFARIVQYRLHPR